MKMLLHLPNRLAVIVLCSALLSGLASASAQTFTKLYDFNGATDGGLVTAELATDANGILYGVTAVGGNNSSGSIFKFDPAQPSSGITLLHSFGGTSVTGPGGSQTDGSGPDGGLVLSGTTLYGTTKTGGTDGKGTVFKINTDGTGYQVLKNFTGTDGNGPSATLVHSGGVLYGSTEFGGSSDRGTVFKFNTDGSGYSVLRSFTGFTDDMTANDDGEGPKGALLLDGNILYGTTAGGGNTQDGTVFKLDITNPGTTYEKQHFSASSTGGQPTGGLVLSGGLLYGTASTGGTGGAGVVFKVATSLATAITPIKSFDGGTDGGAPASALVLNNNLFYGTTPSGGQGGGTVFQIGADGTFAVLKSFAAPDPMTGAAPEGNAPTAALLVSGGKLYGSTYFGGSAMVGIGTIFSVTLATPAPAITSVTGPANGSYKAGQTLSFTVNFSAAVTVTGTPQLPLTVGSTSRNASYASGSGSTALTFTYTVQTGDNDSDGIVSTSPLTLNSGTIKATSGGTDATLTFTPPTTTGVKVDTTAPTVSSVAITSATGIQNSFLNAGDVVSVTVTMSEATTVTGTPQLALNIGGTTVQANYASGTGSSSLVFNYTILASQTDANGISLGANALTLNSGTLADAADNAATLTHTAVADNESYKVDTTAPTVSIGSPSASTATTGPVTYTVTYADANFNASTLANGNITLNKTGDANGTVAVTGSGLTRTVTISSITGSGTLGISIAAGTASDLAGNTAPAAGPSTTFTVVIPNHAPSGANKTITIDEDSTYTFSASDFGFTDPNDTPANTLLAVKITSVPSSGFLYRQTQLGPVVSGQVVPISETLSFVPIPNANGNNYASFTFQVQDNGGTAEGGVDLDQSPNTITFNVTPVSGDPGEADTALSNLGVIGAISATAVQPGGGIILAGSFTSVDSQTRNRIARLKEDGTLDATFNPNANGEVTGVTVQTDGKVLVHGNFTTLQPNGAPSATTRNYIARLNADGTLDTAFDPNANARVHTVVVQSDGKVLLGGEFTTLQPNSAPSATTRNRIARLNADGTLDATFDPNANGTLYSMAVEAEGGILIGGLFTTLQPNGAQAFTARNYLARLNADGSMDTGYNPNPNGLVTCMAVQADGKVLLGGWFTTLQPNSAPSATERNRIARLYGDGTLDSGFNPNANGIVNTLAVQTDGKVLLGGWFTTLQPNSASFATARNRAARVNSDGTLDFSFDSNVDGIVNSVAVQADGKVWLGGLFNTVGGVARANFTRALNDAATQELTVPDNTRIQWLRGGSSPEARFVTFELSTDAGASYTVLGHGTRTTGTTGGWELTGLALPANGQIRARARTSGGQFNSSGGLVEAVKAYSNLPVPEIAVSGNSADIVDGDTTPSTADHTDFGSVIRGSGTVVRTFTIANSGTVELVIGNVTLGGANASEFTVTQTPSSSVAASGNTTFKITFAPTGLGLRTATISFGNNDPSENPFNFTIQGTSLASTDANLSALALSAGTLSPTFASGTVNYTASVPNATTSLTVTPTKAHASATIQARVNGSSYANVSSGSASSSLALAVGANTIEVRVTAEDTTTTKTYTVTVTRLSNNANLSALTLSAGTLSPTFASGTITYTASVPNATASISVIPTTADTTASIQVRVNGGSYANVTSGSVSSSLALNVGANTVDVKVTAQDGTTKTYTVTVTRAGSSNADLSALTLSSGTLTPTFASGTITYTATVPTATSSITVTPTRVEANATIKVNNVSVTSGQPSGSITLNIGANTISVVVTAQDGSTKTYTVTVTREGPPNTAPSFTLAGSWTSRSNPSHWSAVASSADGTKLVGLIYYAYLGFGNPPPSTLVQTSSDSGVEWVTQNNDTIFWWSVASSADGTKLVAGSASGYLYISTDSGRTWSKGETQETWYSVASSADGNKLVAATTSGKIYTSIDSGKTWFERNGENRFQSSYGQGHTYVASSADGTKLVAVVLGGSVYTSVNSGTNWTARSTVGSRPWQSVASSADGTKLVAVDAGTFPTYYGQIYTSVDSGTNWIARPAAGSRQWKSVASSADGSRLVAVANRTQIYTSVNSGETWTAWDSERGWGAVASSADGTKLVATVPNGHIYTADMSFLQQVVLNGAGSQVVFKFAQNISPGPASDAGQIVTFLVSNNNNSLFTVQPAISSTGTLTYTPAVGQTGTATVTVQAKDNGVGTTGGSDTSAAQTFTITVRASVNVSAGDSTTRTLNNQTLANTSGSAITLSGATTLSGSVGIARGPVTFSGAVTVNNGTTLNVSGNQEVTFKNLVANPAGSSLVKTGPGKLVIDGANFNGTITVLEGTVEIRGLNWLTCLSAGGVGTELKGDGTVKCLITKAGSTVKPGASPGTFTTSEEAEWEAGSIYDWEINSATGTAGADPGWDTINIGGTLTLPGTPALPVFPLNEPITIALKSLDLANAAGPMANFNNTTAYSWRIASAAGGITGFNPATIRLDTAGIANDLGGGAFTISKPNATDLMVNFIPAAQLAAPTDIMLLGTTIAEANNFGATIGQFSAVDANTSDNHTYTLVNGTGDTDNASFSIVGNTLQASAVFDYEVKNSYSIRVRVTDAGGLTFEKPFTITVTDVVETATFQPGQIAFVDGLIQLKLQSSGNMRWRIEASSDLTTWTPITTSTPGLDGILNFVDPDSGSTPRRFYRAVLVPPPNP
jgi:uncharacterized delta-60 repeat protein